MTPEQALSYLKVSADSDVEMRLDAAEELLFEYRNHVLRQALIPQLLRKKIEQSLKLADATQALGLDEELQWKVGEFEQLADLREPLGLSTKSAAQQALQLEDTSSLLDFLRAYERALSARKLTLAQAQEPIVFARAIWLLIQLQLNYQVMFAQGFQPWAGEEMDVPSAEELDTGVLIRQLEDHNLGTRNLNDASEPQLTGELAEMIRKEYHRIRKLNLLLQKPLIVRFPA